MSRPDTRSASPQTLPAHPRWDVERDEPYLRLRDFPELRLTPFRAGDDAAVIELQRDPVVARYSYGFPADYKPEDLAQIWQTEHPACLVTITHIKPHFLTADNHRTTPPAMINNVDMRFPMPALRHHPTGKLIGRIMSKQHLGQRDHATGLAPWEFGFNLRPEWRGRGVMKCAMRTVLKGWGRWVGMKRIIATHAPDNLASAAVLRACGFVSGETVWMDWPAHNGGGQRQVTRCEWTAADEASPEAAVAGDLA